MDSISTFNFCLIFIFLYFPPQAFWKNRYPARSFKYELHHISDNFCEFDASLRADEEWLSSGFALDFAYQESASQTSVPGKSYAS